MTLNHFGLASVTMSDPLDYASKLNCHRFYDQKLNFLVLAYKNNVFSSLALRRAKKNTLAAVPINFGWLGGSRNFFGGGSGIWRLRGLSRPVSFKF